MSFFKKERSGPKVGGDCKHGGGIPGAQGSVINVKYHLDGGGDQKGYQQNVVKRSGANK